jgi:recombination protein RecT
MQQLPNGVEHAAWAAAVITEANKVYASATSIATCVYNLAFLGLFPGATLGHAYFVPFKGQATLIVGYKGYTDLAYASGFLKDVHANVICRGEQFTQKTDRNGPDIDHIPDIDRDPNKQNVIGAYCLYHTTTGGHGITVVSAKDILSVARFSSGGKPTPWDTDFAAMAKKTAVRRASKEWKITGRLAHAVRIDEEAERDERQSLPDGLIIDGEAIEASTYQLPTE